MCSPSVVPLAVRTCMRELYSIWYGGLGGVGSIHECYLHASTVCGPLEQCLAWLARAMYISFSCLYSYFACTHTVLVLVRCLYHCTVCTVLVPLVQCSGMADAGNAPTYPRLSSYCACIIAQCVLCLHPLYSGLAWPARAMYLFSPCLYSYCGCTIAQCVLCLYLLYSVPAWPARVMYLYYQCLYSYCASTIAQCVLCLYPLYSVLAWQARAMHLLTRVCARTVRVPLHSVYCACTPCTVVWHGQHGQCTYLARV